MSTYRCLAAHACRSGTHDQGATTTEPDTLCPPCDTYFAGAIRQLPKDWNELRAALGERSVTAGTKIRSTPTPAIPISTRKEALMAGIVDMLDRAAAIVSDRLSTGQPATYHGRGVPVHADHTVRASVALVEPNMTVLISAPVEPMMVWAKPARCDTHTRLIGAADERCTAAGTNVAKLAEAHKLLCAAYAAAGLCDDCNGWGRHGQERELVELAGLDIALELIDLHHQTRAELGHTRLRHRYPMPCPRCGSRVGRDDGETIITCDNRDTCKASWTEREYQFLAGLITRERLDMEILKWLLAEAYTRLDDVQSRLNKITEDDTAALDLPGAGTIVAAAVHQALGDHKTPDQRAIATDRKTTDARQKTEDAWAWGNETAYRPPKPKLHKKASRPAGSPSVHPGSLTTLVDLDEHPAVTGRPACPECNLIHAGECA